MRSLKASAKIVDSYIVSTARHRKRLIAALRARRELFEYEKGNPVYLGCCWVADSIAFQNVSSSGSSAHFPGGTNRTAGKNIAKCQVVSKGTGSKIVEYTHRFSTSFPVSGHLTAIALLDINGRFDILVNGDCWPSGGQLASLGVLVRLEVSQIVSGLPITVTSPTRVLCSQSLSSGCSGAHNTGPIQLTDDSLANDTPFPVIANQPVEARVITRIVTSALQITGSSDPFADVIFDGNTAFGIGIPTVWMSVDA